MSRVKKMKQNLYTVYQTMQDDVLQNYIHRLFQFYREREMGRNRRDRKERGGGGGGGGGGKMCSIYVDV